MENNPEIEQAPASHYYGDIVRVLFIIAGVIMITTLPFVLKYSVPIYVSFIIILCIGVAAGFTAPQLKWFAVFNLIVAVSAFLIFEYYSIFAFQTYGGVENLFFLVNQLLALNFFFATYFSAKTVRGFLL